MKIRTHFGAQIHDANIWLLERTITTVGPNPYGTLMGIVPVSIAIFSERTKPQKSNKVACGNELSTKSATSAEIKAETASVYFFTKTSTLVSSSPE